MMSKNINILEKIDSNIMILESIKEASANGHFMLTTRNSYYIVKSVINFSLIGANIYILTVGGVYVTISLGNIVSLIELKYLNDFSFVFDIKGYDLTEIESAKNSLFARINGVASINEKLKNKQIILYDVQNNVIVYEVIEKYDNNGYSCKYSSNVGNGVIFEIGKIIEV